MHQNIYFASKYKFCNKIYIAEKKKYIYVYYATKYILCNKIYNMYQNLNSNKFCST